MYLFIYLLVAHEPRVLLFFCRATGRERDGMGVAEGARVRGRARGRGGVRKWKQRARRSTY